MYEDVKDGIRTNISVGYRINKMEAEDDDDKTGTFIESRTGHQWKFHWLAFQPTQRSVLDAMLVSNLKP